MMTCSSLYTQHLAQGQSHSELTENACGMSGSSMKCLSNEGLSAVCTVWDNREGSNRLLRGSGETPFCGGVGQKRKDQQSSILVAKDTNRQFPEETQNSMNYDREVFNITNNQKSANDLIHGDHGNTNWKSLLGELFDSIKIVNELYS